MSNEQDKVKHSKRLHKLWSTVKRQLKIAKSIGNTKYINEPHRLAKHHAADCGQPGCVYCTNPRHNKSYKGKEKLTIQEQRNEQRKDDE
jgi:uncharacterized protein (DUF2147 family)